MKNEDLRDTGIGITVTVDGVFVGIAALLTDGRWETHADPIESSPWLILDTANAAVALLCDDHADRLRGQDVELAQRVLAAKALVMKK